MPSSDGDQPTTRKRQRTSRTTIDDSKKTRGRPRVEPQDETAADRRRTQIRLAQRAYRQRKEITIASLKGQVEKMQTTIEDMNKTFLQFNDRIVDSGLLQSAPELARDLKVATERFLTLARAASHSIEDEENSDVAMRDLTEESDKIQPIASLETVPATNETAQGDWGLFDGYRPDSSPEYDGVLYAQEDPVAAMAHATAVVHKNREPVPAWHADGSMALTTTTTKTPFSVHDQSKMPFNLDYRSVLSSPLTTLEQFTPLTEASLDLLSPAKSSSIRAPYTYSFQETSFARRLHRAAVEKCYHLLSQQPDSPILNNHTLKLTLQFKTHDEILTRFRQVLQRSTDESLEFLQSPYIHLGGAGTHYPPRDEQGNAIPRPNSYYVRRIGPLTSLENTQHPGVTLDLPCDTSEFAGVWFDPQDVEGYLLQEKGLRIDPQASFAEAEIISSPVQLDMTMGPNLAASSSPESSGGDLTNSVSMPSISRPQTPNMLEALASMPDFSDLDSYLFNGPEVVASQITSHDDVPDYFSQVWNTSLEFKEDDSTPNRPPKQVERRTVTLDVTKFITELLVRGTCLGRTPGFRKNDVDLAFNAAIIPAF